MDTALCEADGQEYTAYAFSRLPAEDIARLRHSLVCLGKGCGAVAFYRGRSRDGRAPCFGSTHHVPGCNAAHPGAELHGSSGVGVAVDEVRNTGARVRVDFSEHADDGRVHHRTAAEDVGPGVTPRHTQTASGGAADAVSIRTPRGILRELIRSGALARGEQVIEVDGWDPKPARDFFHYMPEVTARNVGEPGGYWGQVADAHAARNGTLWLDFDSADSAHLIVSSSKVPAFLDAQEGAIASLKGLHILAFGVLKLSSIGNLYVSVDFPLKYATHRDPV